MGPNTTTGHLSVLFSTECEVNFTLRVLRPILGALYPSRIWSILTYPFRSLLSPAPNTVAVTPAAEQADNNWIQKAANKLVWATGCTSWYVDSRTGRNTMLYPDWQFNFWARSIFVPLRRDFVFGRSQVQLPAKDSKKGRSVRLGGMFSGFGVLGVALVVGLIVGSQMDVNDVEIAKGLRDAVTRVQSECVTGLRSLLVLAGWKAV
jgi:hypothetical protein